VEALLFLATEVTFAGVEANLASSRYCGGGSLPQRAASAVEENFFSAPSLAALSSLLVWNRAFARARVSRSQLGL
jgi:hypothetical protein